MPGLVGDCYATRPSVSGPPGPVREQEPELLGGRVAKPKAVQTRYGSNLTADSIEDPSQTDESSRLDSKPNNRKPHLAAVKVESTAADPPAGRIVSELKRFGRDSLEQKDGISGIDIGAAALALVNDLARHPNTFVIGCIADRWGQSYIAWRLPHKIREAVGDFEFDTFFRLRKSVWSSVLASSGHRLASEMERGLPEAIRLIGDRYCGDGARIWAPGSSGATVARPFLTFDGVGAKIANMAVNVLIRISTSNSLPHARHRGQHARGNCVCATGPPEVARTERA